MTMSNKEKDYFNELEWIQKNTQDLYLPHKDYIQSSENVLDFNKNLSFESKQEIFFKSPLNFVMSHVVPSNKKAKFIGNFRLEINSKYKLRDILYSLDIEIGGNTINKIYPEGFDSVFMCQNSKNRSIDKIDKKVYFLPGIRYLQLKDYYETRFWIKFKNFQDSDVKLIYDYYNNSVPKIKTTPNDDDPIYNYLLIPYYQTYFHGNDKLDHNEPRFYTRLSFNGVILYLNIELYDSKTKNYSKILSKQFEEIILEINGRIVIIDKNLLKYFEEKYGNGIIPLTKFLDFKNRIGGISLNNNWGSITLVKSTKSENKNEIFDTVKIFGAGYNFMKNASTEYHYKMRNLNKYNFIAY
uniref:Uncharacterized protein n=1 Tax=viral metagenome TaxID=1070528 RepID=A0A6C0AD61_9ZZZZ